MSEAIEKYLLCEEHIDKCKKPLGLYNSKHIEDEPCLMCDIEQLQRENDALVARVARLKELGSLMLSESDDETAAVLMNQFEKALEETPSESLAHIQAAAHMAGQAECGCDPSWSLAQEYASKQGKTHD